MTSKSFVYPLVGMLVVSVVSGCAPDAGVARVDAGHGKTLYAENCAQCHGENGEGAGPASLGLGTAPPALTTLSANNGGVFPRDYVMSVIDGYTRENKHDAAMPEFGAGDMGTLIMVEKDGLATPIPSDLLALAAYLETIQE